MWSVSIDDNGLYVPGSDDPEYQGVESFHIVTTPIPTDQTFWHPRWTGTWDGKKWVSGEWVEGHEKPDIDPPPSAPDWVGLLSEVRGTPIFAKVYAASKLSLPIQSAYTLLLSTLTSTEPHINDLAFALQDLKANMLNLNADDIKFINQTLAKYHFPISI